MVQGRRDQHNRHEQRLAPGVKEDAADEYHGRTAAHVAFGKEVRQAEGREIDEQEQRFVEQHALCLPTTLAPVQGSGLRLRWGCGSIRTMSPRENRMAEIRTAHLMTLTLAVAGMQPVGATPNGNRRIGLVSGGSF